MAQETATAEKLFWIGQFVVKMTRYPRLEEYDWQRKGTRDNGSFTGLVRWK